MAWYDSAWLKRKAITLTGGTSGAQTDYQVQITVTYDSDMKSDFSDLRFTKADGTTLLYAWLDSNTASTSAIIWVKTDTPANTVEADIYMYYGNTLGLSRWDPANTFIFGDDFADGNNDGWGAITSRTGDTRSAATGEFVQTKGSTSGYLTTGSPSQGSITAKKRWVCKIRMTNYDTFHSLQGDESEGWNPAIHIRSYSGTASYYSTAYTTLATGLTIDDYYYYEIIPDVSTDTFDIHIYDDSWNEVTYASSGVNIGCANRQNVTYLEQFYVSVSPAYHVSYLANAFIAEYVTNPATYVFGSESTEPPWSIGDWSKRKAITLTGGASGAQTDYQVKLTVTYDSDMKSDFSDLRFTKADGTTLLDAWMESHTASTSAIVWVETDTPANTVEADIYMYYGNSGASSRWNIRNTMLDGDDFLDSSLNPDIWTNQACDISISGGELTLSNFKSTYSRFKCGILGRRLMDLTSVVECRLKSMYSNDLAHHGFADDYGYHDDSAGICLIFNNDYGYTYNDGSDSHTSYTSNSAGTYYKYKTEVYETGVKFYRNDVELSGSPVTTDVPDEDMYLSIMGDADDSPTLKIDYIFSYKYVANPATSAFGSEEEVSSGSPMWYYNLLRRRNI